MFTKTMARGLLAACLGSVFSLNAAWAAVGNTAGTFDVTPGGAATYQIPITVPPGTAGMEPRLSLRYASGSDSGLLGVGWSLDGLSSIARCPATLAQDGFADGVDFDANDRLCLDGARLVAVSGTYGQNGTEYRTEIERFARIRQNGGDLNTGNAWFEVRTKSGLIQEFGRRNNAAFDVPGKTYTHMWSVDRIADTVGNYIAVHYASDATTHEHYVDRIDYTANDLAGVSAYNSVRFEYDATGRPDRGESYVVGGSQKITAARRLAAIKTYAQSAVVREYNLTYTTGTTSGRSLLAGLEECAYPESSLKDCLPAMMFEWTTTTPGYTVHPSLTPPFNLRNSDGARRGEAIDVNSDGLTDFVRAHGSTRTTWLQDLTDGQQSFETNSGYKLPKPLFTDSGKPRATLVDVNGDGLPDLVEGYSESNQRTYLNTGSGWALDDAYQLPRRIYNNGGSTDPARVEGVLADLNGDGLVDLLLSTRTVLYDFVDGQYTNFSFENEINEAYLNQGANCSGTACRWQRASNYDLPRESLFLIVKPRDSSDDGELLVRGHLNDLSGDGLPDYAYIRTFPPDPAGAVTIPPSEVATNTGTGWASVTSPLPVPVGEYFYAETGSGLIGVIPPAELADVNGDGLADVVCSMLVVAVEYDINQAHVCGTATTTTLLEGSTILKSYYARATYLNTGDGYVSEPTYNLPDAFFVNAGNLDPRGAIFQDLNDDGRPEFIKAHGDQPRETYLNQYATQCTTEGCKWSLAPDYRLPFDYFESFDARVRGAFSQLDLDGRVDFVASAEGIENAIYVTNGRKIHGDRPDLIERIDPGVSAVKTEVRYTTLLDSRNFTRGTANYPRPSVVGTQSVVAASKRVTGTLTSTSNYRYADLRTDLRGRGLQGFATLVAENSATGIRQTTTFEQAFPHTGMARESVTEAVDAFGNTNTLTRTLNTLVSTTLGSGTAARHFPHVSRSDKQVFDLVNNAAPLTTTRTETTYDSFGNATQVIQKRFQGASPGVDTHTSVTTSLYTNDTSQWLLGRLTSSTVTKTNPNNVSLTRETAFEYDPVSGLLTAEIVEPNDLTLRKRTEYQYDSFGNQTQVTLSGDDIATRATSTAWDSRGQFKTSVTNALGHSESHVYSPRHGGQTSLTGPNSLTTTWAYDAFGRPTLQTAPDGTTVATAYEFCRGSCAVGWGALRIRTTGSDGSESVQVTDGLERTVLEAKKGYDGNWIDVVTQYDERDRVSAKSAPHYRGHTQYWTTYQYDDHDRVVRTESPTNDSSSGGLVTQVAYDGLITRQTDPHGKVSEKHANAAGQTVKVVDALTNATTFAYDPYGNRTQVTDVAGNVTTVQYDTLGRKVAMSDPDMGDWTYDYNVLGELVSQTDAKAQTVTLTYDPLGRRIQRTELEGTTTWEYDTTWMGNIHRETAPGGFDRQYVYDSLGRVKDVATDSVGASTFTISRTYDDQSRLKRLTYPSGLVVRHDYNDFGYMIRVLNVSNNTVYWRLDHRDAFGNVELETLGNGHSTLRNYDDARGHVDTIMTGASTGTEVQSLNYAWNKTGNLLSRTDQNQNGLVEAFEYDDLYRLTGSTLNGNTNLTVAYDAIGNITSKSGVGTYTYGAGGAGPHAVTEITGTRAATYSYDANGNMTDSAGRKWEWTSFNKPATIERGQPSSQFLYDPNRARFYHVRQRDENGILVTNQIYYVGGIFERHYEDFGFEDKHYIRADGRTIAIEITRSSGVGETQYLHRDHLGSVTAVTNALGDIVQRYAYDAFGKRRALDWNPDNGDGLLYLLTEVLDRGYTGHEHLDQVGLIHMNGRVYDPILGRFTSADPFVQFPESTQGLNRYTYVNNSPLSYTDPSGFFSFSLGDLFKALINPAILVNEYIMDNPRQAVAIGIVVLPGGQLQGFAAFAAASAKGFAAGMVAGRGDLRTGLIGAATAGAFYGVGSAFENSMVQGWVGEAGSSTYIVAKTIVHGAVGGAASDWYGGSFTDGFLGAATGQAFGAAALSNATDRGTRVGLAALVGGTAAHIGGGKFANGAITAAFGQAFNECQHGDTCWTTSEERAALDNKDYGAYYRSACSGGDTYACAAGEIAAGETPLAKFTMDRLQSYALSDRGSVLSVQESEAIRLELAEGYANSLGTSPSTAVTPNGMDIARIHWNVFSGHDIYSPGAFGGTPFGALHVLTGPAFMHSYPPPFSGPGWCTICE